MAIALRRVSLPPRNGVKFPCIKTSQYSAVQCQLEAYSANRQSYNEGKMGGGQGSYPYTSMCGGKNPVHHFPS